MSVARVFARLERRRKCRGKEKHASKGKAEAHIRSLRQAAGDGDALESYFCPFCFSWHVGNARVRT